ncbi:plastocyanin/azurin family copper-binding protein [Hoyosella sp. YIM 151337]|uniref:plastocyanin/azurin family copper-binding protein n=1 Tax=Hoyosella sp. YIM 151337 TaxID=2992742 RepID=UPI0022357856|nr:plastocyanin/azurin family copper-binding protein [Hoyosella sp. YIM 151337]MCW4352411.1 plastocyanin/azurin family copper-binding protein [Hoyosella sp. YIM 151337]
MHEGDGPAVVHVSNMHYTPETLVIDAGTTVEWVFDDGPIAHNVVGVSENSPPDFASPMIAQDTWSYTFESPGEYEYICSEHPQKTGVIVVEEP